MTEDELYICSLAKYSREFLFSCKEIEILDVPFENMYFAGRQTNGLTFDIEGNITYSFKPIEGAPDEYWTYIENYTGKSGNRYPDGVPAWKDSNFPE